MRQLQRWTLAAVSVVAGVAAPVSAQNWLAGYERRAAATQVDQPHWATPLITSNARVEQGLRADFTRQTGPTGATTWNDGGSKGLQIIPFARTELRFSPPPFFSHSDPKKQDGFGDVAFRLKVRAYGSNESHHNAIVSVLLAASLPTGKSGNGSCCALLQPSVEAGKGFGALTLTSSAGGVLPMSNTVGLGRSVVWNNAAQYRIGKFVWPQMEINSTYYFGGKYDGRTQVFATPGVVVSRIPLLRGAPGRAGGQPALALTLGVGEQIALTHFNTYNHAPVISGRLRF